MSLSKHTLFNLARSSEISVIVSPLNTLFSVIIVLLV